MYVTYISSTRPEVQWAAIASTLRSMRQIGRALLTTTGAAKFYRSAGFEVRLTQRMSFAGDSCLE